MNNNNKCLISIITINFNDLNGLRRTLESVKEQTFNDYEHIIIDGGSTDGSADVIKEFLNDEKYSKHVSYWCSEKDNGIYNAMNKGIEHAKGKYIYMLNSGDLVEQYALEYASKYLYENTNKILYGAVDGFDGNTYKGTFSHSADELNQVMIPHQATFVPLDIHKKYGLYNEIFKIVADRELMVRFKKAGVEFIHIPVIVCKYNFDGISSRNSKLIKIENQKITNSHYSKKKIIFLKIRHCIKISLDFILPGFLSILISKIANSIKKKV